MQPHPRIRKTIKWGGLVLTVLLVAVWIGSGWRAAVLKLPSGHFLELTAGLFQVVYVPDTRHELRWGCDPHLDGQLHFGWWFQYVDVAGFWGVAAPGWVVLVPLIASTGLAWRLDTLARRRARKNLCPTCRYDRTGLASPSAPCPECGSPPPRHP